MVAGGLDGTGSPAADVLAFDVDGLEPVRHEGPGGPGGLVAPALAGDPAGERLLLFGGEVDGAASDGLWELVLD